MTKLPNFYQFATKELAQDATLAYILAWAQPEYLKTHPGLHNLGAEMLRSIIHTRIAKKDIPNLTSVDVGTQVNRVDVLIRVNDENENGIVVLIEDKLGSNEHSNQIERYFETASEYYPNRTIIPIYIKTGNVSELCLPSKEKCGRFLRSEILSVLARFANTGDTIVDNFRTHLQEIENETNNFKKLKISKWNDEWKRIEGFYTELEKRMRNDSSTNWKQWGWSYVHNPQGGLIWFAFAGYPIDLDLNEANIYLQIQNATRLNIRISAAEGVRKDSMYHVLDILNENISQTDGFSIEKAGRFRGGSSAAVVEIKFGDENGYLASNIRGIVDMESTIQRLRRVWKFIDRIKSLL